MILHFILCNVSFWERQSMSGGEAEREGDTASEAGSRLWAVCTGPDAGLEPTNCKIVTWAEVGRLTDWATQAPYGIFKRLGLRYNFLSSCKSLEHSKEGDHWPVTLSLHLVLSLASFCITEPLKWEARDLPRGRLGPRQVHWLCEPAPTSPINGWHAICKPGSGLCIWTVLGAALIAIYFEIYTREWAKPISVAA